MPATDSMPCLFRSSIRRDAPFHCMGTPLPEKKGPSRCSPRGAYLVRLISLRCTRGRAPEQYDYYEDERNRCVPKADLLHDLVTKELLRPRVSSSPSHGSAARLAESESGGRVSPSRHAFENPFV